MSSSPERSSVTVLRAADAEGVQLARIDTDLRSSPYALRFGADARLVDPSLEKAFALVAAKVSDAARAEGYAAGWAEGRRAAVAEVREHAAAERRAAAAVETQRTVAFGNALVALSRAADALESRAVVPAAHAEQAITTGAFELLKVLLARELELAQEPGLDAVRRALALAPLGRPVTVRLNPADHGAVAGLPARIDGREVVLVADPSVAPGDAIADCDATRIDARLSEAVERVRKVLAP